VKAMAERALQHGYKVVAVVSSNEFASLLPQMRRVYRVGEWYDDGPFFLCRTRYMARWIAAYFSDVGDLAIFRAQYEPVQPQPTLLPAPELAASEAAEHWRRLVYQDPKHADAVDGLPHRCIRPDSIVLAWRFRLIGKPLTLLRDGEWVAGPGDAERVGIKEEVLCYDS
jgi:hypothetical protein